jgi:transposase
VRAMKLFVAAMGASNYTYAEAVASEGLEDWIRAHVRMFAFLGGVPKAVVQRLGAGHTFQKQPSRSDVDRPTRGGWHGKAPVAG